MNTLFYFVFINLMFIIDCEIVTSTIKNDPKLFTQPDEINKRTKSLITEGGAIELENLYLKDKDNQDPLLGLDQEGVKLKDKPSVRRNGAILNEIIPSEIEKLTSHKETSINSLKESENNMHIEVHQNDSVVPIDVVNANNRNQSRPHKLNSNITNKHKPSILSYEDFSNLDTPPIQHRTRLVQNESENESHINKETEITSKLHATNSKSQPDLVMPVVITILIVPLFVVFGYMALQKGREAWKNRHYKRMDFLLDGMYNE